MPTQNSTPVLTEKQLQLFFSKIKISTTKFYCGVPCQEWVGNRLKFGYGTLKVNGKMYLAHRVAWLIAHKQIPANKPCVLHYCDNPACCEELHLFTGTKKDNADDRERKGRGNQPKGERHGRAKLLDMQIPKVFYLRSLGLSQQKIGDIMGVGNGQISRILSGKYRK